MSNIIRYEDVERNGLFQRYLYGLRIFAYNGAKGIEDGMVTFLRALVTTYPCAAQIGLETLEGDDPREFFAPLQEGKDYVLTQIDGCSHGRLWVVAEPPGGCFFPRLTEDFFALKYDEERTLIDYLLIYDQPLLYVNVDEKALVQLGDLYAHPPLPNDDDFPERWWKEITRIVPVGLQGGYDDSMMTAYSRDPAHFQLLDRPLAQTCAAIQATPWFQAHQQELQWFEGYDSSMLLPEIYEREEALEAQYREKMQGADE